MSAWKMNGAATLGAAIVAVVLAGSAALGQLESPVISAGGVSNSSLTAVAGQPAIGIATGVPGDAQLGAVHCWALAAACPGDADGDGAVTIGDLGAVLANYGLTGGATLEDGDFDGDGDVDIGDLGQVLSVFGTVCG